MKYNIMLSVTIGLALVNLVYANGEEDKYLASDLPLSTTLTVSPTNHIYEHQKESKDEDRKEFRMLEKEPIFEIQGYSCLRLIYPGVGLSVSKSLSESSSLRLDLEGVYSVGFSLSSYYEQNFGYYSDLYWGCGVGLSLPIGKGKSMSPLFPLYLGKKTGNYFFEFGVDVVEDYIVLIPIPRCKIGLRF